MSQCFKGLLLILHVPWEGQVPLEDLSQGQSSSNISAGIWDSPGASIIFLFWLCVNEEFEHKIYSLLTPLYLCRLLGETQSLGDIVKQTGKLKKEFGKWSIFAFLCVFRLEKGRHLEPLVETLGKGCIDQCIQHAWFEGLSCTKPCIEPGLCPGNS